MVVVPGKRLALQAAFFIALTHGSALAQDNDLAAESHHAKELMAAQRYAEAIPIYEHLVKALPGNPGLLLNLALAEEMGGQPARSIPHFEAVLKAQPESVPALISLSMARLQLNQPVQALAPLRKVLALDPQNRNVLGMLADAEMSQNLAEDAAAHYRELVQQEDADARAWYGLGKAYEALAAHTFDVLNKSAPESPYVAMLLAETRLQRHQYRSAFFFYREAQKKLPDYRGIHAGLERVYRNTDHADWADAEKKRAETDAPPDCKTDPAECSFLAGNFLDAVKSAHTGVSPATLFWATKAYNALARQAFDRLSQLPESLQIHAFKAQILRDHKQDLEAANEWRAALKLSPEDGKVKRELAAALFDAKDYQGAIPLVQEQLSEEPNAPELNYLLGASLFRTEQAEKALAYLQTAVQGRPEILAADGALGLTLVSLNRNSEAIPYLIKALALDDDGSVHYSLARAYKAAGQTQLAAQAMGQYQKIQQQNEQINGELAKEAEIAPP